MKMSRKLRAVAILSLLASTSAVPAVAQESVLKIRLPTDLRSTDPGVNRDGPSDAIVMHVLEGLVGYRDDTTIAPLLAKSIDVSADGKTYTFTLRDGVKFSSGAPLTSEDVVFSWNRYVDPKTAWRCLADVTGKGAVNVTKVEAPTPSTVVFHLEKPTALFLATLARTDCGGTGIYSKESLDADGKWKAPVGTGPFVMGEWRPGQYVDLTANRDYAPLEGKVDGYVGDKSPKVDRVRFMVIPDDSAAKAALYAGNIDVIPDVANPDVSELKARDDVKFQEVPGMGITAVLLQTRDPILKDVRVREALRSSLDLAQIAEVVSEGLSKASYSVIPQASSYFGKAQAEVPARDLEKAKALLAEAGYRGEPIKWMTTESIPALYNAAVLSQAMAQEAGINIQLETYDWATMLDRYNKGSFTAMSFSYSARLDPFLSFDMVSGNKDEKPNKVWDNAKGREILAESGRVSDPAERQKYFDQLEGMLRADVPLIVLYSGSRTSATRTDIEGYQTWSVGQPRAWGVSIAKKS
jgi:peptide/nickel transport system substrate-binding protein